MLHADELASTTDELEAVGQAALASRLRTYRDLHTQETELIAEELAEIRDSMVTWLSSEVSE
jgi:hypothetical protein